MRHTDDRLTITEAANAIGIHKQLLRTWEERYGWPRAMRERGCRVYTPRQVDEIRRFNLAGRPFHEIEAGCWLPRSSSAPQEPRQSWLWEHAHAGVIEPALKRDLLRGHRGRIAAALALLARVHPFQRQPILQCIRDASDEMGRAYEDLIERFAPKGAM